MPTTNTIRTLTAILADIRAEVKSMNTTNAPEKSESANKLLKEYAQSAQAKAFREHYATAYPMESAITAYRYPVKSITRDKDTNEWTIADGTKILDFVAFIGYMNDRSADKSGKTAPTTKKLAAHALDKLAVFTATVNALDVEGNTEKAVECLEYFKRSKGVNVNPAEIKVNGKISATKHKQILESVAHDFITVRHEVDENGNTVEKPIEINSQQYKHFMKFSVTASRDIIGQEDAKSRSALTKVFYEVLNMATTGNNPTFSMGKNHGDTRYTYTEPETKKNNGKKDEKPADEKTAG